MKKLVFAFLTICTILCVSCQKDDFEPEMIQEEVGSFEPDFGATITADFVGKVVDENGVKLSDVQITIGTATTYTDHNGIFILNNVDVYEKFAYVKAYKDGYIKGSRAVIPTRNQTSDIQITLLRKEVTAVISSGTENTVNLSNGAKVTFGGDFIDASGNPYSGQVNVVTHYLEPNTEETFTQMPGMLLAQNNNNELSSLETYGMLSVNLYSSSGQELNISSETPALLEFPVDNTQTNIAPDTIPLWYFDEESGLWVEDGFAQRVGNKYIGEVTHFTWWNCDLPLDYASVCFTLKDDSFELSSYYVEIKRNSTGQLIYSGYTNTNGQECGLFPAGEEVTIYVYGQNSCASAIISETVVGPFTEDTSITIHIDTTDDLHHTTITGAALNCDGNPITEGYVYFFQ